jgi:hypothetical protein
MFLIQNCGTVTKIPMPDWERRPYFVAILNYWRENSDARKAIIANGCIQPLFQDMGAPGLLCGISYELEPHDYGDLFALFKLDQFRCVVVPERTSEHMADQYTEELHDVYRILRAKTKSV